MVVAVIIIIADFMIRSLVQRIRFTVVVDVTILCFVQRYTIVIVAAAVVVINIIIIVHYICLLARHYLHLLLLVATKLSMIVTAAAAAVCDMIMLAQAGRVGAVVTNPLVAGSITAICYTRAMTDVVSRVTTAAISSANLTAIRRRGT